MDEKTQPPTKRKLAKEKKEGNLPFSQELSASLILLSGLLSLWFLAPLFYQRFKLSFISIYSTLKEPNLFDAMQKAFYPLILPTMLTLILLFLAAFLAAFLQQGWIWSWKFKKGGSKTPWFLVLLRVLLLAIVAFVFLKKIFVFEGYLSISFIFKKIGAFLITAAIALTFVGIIDLFYQRWAYHKKLRMSFHEIKEEKREAEGDSKTKSKFRKN